MSVWSRIKGFFCKNNTDARQVIFDASLICKARDINLSLLAIKDELVTLNNILQARVDNMSINPSSTLTNPKEPVILGEDTEDAMYIPSPETELEANIRLEEKDTDSEALNDAMAKYKAARGPKPDGKNGGTNE